MAITAVPNSTVGTLPAGWRKCIDIPDGKKRYRRRAIFRGPANLVDSADEAIRTMFGGLAADASDSESDESSPQGKLSDINHSRSVGSGVAEIEVLYVTATGTGGGGDDEEPEDDTPIADDTVSLTPQTIPVALASHPMFDGKSAAIATIEGYILQNKIANALGAAGVDDALRRYIAMRLSGITTWNTTGYTLTCVRHFAPGAVAQGLLASVLENTGKVFNWAGVNGSDVIGVEPKWIDVADGNAAKSFEWLLVGGQPTASADSYDITITYQGAWKWCADLYQGGGWTPEVPSVES